MKARNSQPNTHEKSRRFPIRVAAAVVLFMYPVGASADALLCAAEKLTSATVTAQRLLECQSDFLASGNDPDGCIGHAEQDIQDEFDQIETLRNCSVAGDASDLFQLAEELAEDSLDLIGRPNPSVGGQGAPHARSCGERVLLAVGSYTGQIGPALASSRIQDDISNLSADLRAQNQLLINAIDLANGEVGCDSRVEASAAFRVSADFLGVALEHLLTCDLVDRETFLNHVGPRVEETLLHGESLGLFTASHKLCPAPSNISEANPLAVAAADLVAAAPQSQAETQLKFYGPGRQAFLVRRSSTSVTLLSPVTGLEFFDDGTVQAVGNDGALPLAAVAAASTHPCPNVLECLRDYKESHPVEWYATLLGCAVATPFGLAVDAYFCAGPLFDAAEQAGCLGTCVPQGCDALCSASGRCGLLGGCDPFVPSSETGIPCDGDSTDRYPTCALLNTNVIEKRCTGSGCKPVTRSCGADVCVAGGCQACGNGVLDVGEECDAGGIVWFAGSDESACPGLCAAPGEPLECTCAIPDVLFHVTGGMKWSAASGTSGSHFNDPIDCWLPVAPAVAPPGFRDPPVVCETSFEAVAGFGSSRVELSMPSPNRVDLMHEVQFHWIDNRTGSSTNNQAVLDGHHRITTYIRGPAGRDFNGRHTVAAVLDFEQGQAAGLPSYLLVKGNFGNVDVVVPGPAPSRVDLASSDPETNSFDGLFTSGSAQFVVHPQFGTYYVGYTNRGPNLHIMRNGSPRPFVYKGSIAARVEEEVTFPAPPREVCGIGPEIALLLPALAWARATRRK